MITCSVCGHLNDSSNATCEECGSDLIDETEYYELYGDDQKFFLLNNKDFIDNLESESINSL